MLHDGAPNVGTAWVQDAYTQNELVLQSLKLAAEFLVPSGAFVTKVFRSKDYNSLLWVFNQLFTKVEATKPPSSRNVSAEIFVVCQGFKAPKRIDPKFLDPKYVFKDLDVTTATIGEDPEATQAAAAAAAASTSTNGAAAAGTSQKSLTSVARLAHNAQANVFEPEKRKRKREGYEEGNLGLHRTVSAKVFIEAPDAVGMLGTFNQITLPPIVLERLAGKSSKGKGKSKSLSSSKESGTGGPQDATEAALAQHHATDAEIAASCADLRVLGKREFRALLKWRLAIREELGLESSAKAAKERADDAAAAAASAAAAAEAGEGGAEVVEISEEQREAELDAELERLNEERVRRLRKERRRRNENRQRETLKLQLKMGTPMDIGMDLADEALHGGQEFFDLGNAEREQRQRARKAAGSDDEEGESGDEEVPDFDPDAASDDDDEFVDAQEDEDDEEDEDEEAARLARLEEQVDALYDRYKEDLQARDAKFKASEARRQAGNRAHEDQEWYGIQDKAHDSDDEDGSDIGRAGQAADSDDEGGYDGVMGRKTVEETYDTEDEEDDEDEREDRLAEQEERKKRQKRAAAIAEDAAKASKSKSAITSTSTAKGKQPRSLITDLESSAAKEAKLSREANIWFDNPLFKDLAAFDAQAEEEEEEDEGEGEEDEDAEDDDDDDEEEEESEEEEDDEEEEDEEAQESEDEEDDFEVVPQDASDDEGTGWAYEDEDLDAAKREKIERMGLTTAEAVAMAQALVNRKENKASLIDAGFSKANFVDKNGLPTWFLDDEAKFYKSNIPITKEAVQALRARQRALDARPIKKIAEAKARKKYKAAQRLEKARKKAEGVLAEEEGSGAAELNEREKASSIEKILRKGAKAQKRKEVKVVVARGANRGLAGRPKGLKGRYRMVDSRGKKELRAQRRADKKAGRKSTSTASTNKRRVPNGYGSR